MNTSRPTEGSNRREHELDNWENYITCKWIDNPGVAPLPDSPDLIPDSEPNNSTTASGEETGGSEEDLASVPSTVQVGSPEPLGPGSSEGDGNASPVRSPGGSWRNQDGS